MTVRGKILLFLLVSLGLNALQGLAQYQGERIFERGQLLTIVIPMTALGGMLALAMNILLPMNRRFRELLTSIERIGRGEPGWEFPNTGHDEFGTLAHIFEPFFSTKPAGHTGLGLFMCRHSITASGGTLGVESEPDRGTTFRITLPVAPRPTDS